MKKIVYLIILVSLLPLSAFTQQNKKVKDALTYINQQFEDYNAYNMQWKVDEIKKTITSTSTYYKITYPLSSISLIKYNNSSQVMEFTCIDEENCISLFDLDTKKTSTKSTNSANLTCGTTIGKKVVDAFYTIQSELSGKSEVKTVSTNLPNKPIKNANVKKALTYINEQFKEYNAYDMQWGVDEENKILVSKSKYFRVEYPLATISSFKFKTEIVTLTCSGDDECISSLDLDDKTTSTKSSNTVNLTSDIGIGEKVIDAFYTIQSELTGSVKTNSSSSELPNKPIKNAKVKEALNYINEQFKEYNAYDMQWGVDEVNKILVSKSMYYRVEYPLASISSFEYTNKIVKLTCSDDDCITSLDLEYKTTSNKSSNTVNLTSNGVIGDKVIEAFYTIQSELTGGVGIVTNNNINNDTKVDEAIEYINTQFELYNKYDVQFSLDKTKGNLKSKSKYFQVTYPIKSLKKIVLYKRDVKDYLVEFYCKEDGKCIKSFDIETEDISYQSSYSVNLTCSQVIGDKVIEAFVTIVKAYGGKLVQDDDE